MNQLTVFKIRLDSVSQTSIKFELYVGDHLKDSFINVLTTGGYGIKNRFSLSPKNFADFAMRLIAYVYTTKTTMSDEQLKVLWDMKITIWDHESQSLSQSIFMSKNIRESLSRLQLIK